MSKKKIATRINDRGHIYIKHRGTEWNASQVGLMTKEEAKKHFGKRWNEKTEDLHKVCVAALKQEGQGKSSDSGKKSKSKS